MSIIFEPSLLPTCFVASNSTVARNAKGVARKNRISTDVRVDDTGIEPVTPTMSMWCSTAEPIVRTV